jgi:hypothetical protein
MKKLVFLLFTIFTLSVYSQSYTTGYKFWIKHGYKGKMESHIVTSAQLPEWLAKNNLKWVAKIPNFTSSVYSEVQTDSVYCYVEMGTVYFKDSGKVKFKRVHK